MLCLCVSLPPGMEEALAGQLAAGAAYSETISLHKLKRILAVPSNWIIILQVGRAAHGYPAASAGACC